MTGASCRTAVVGQHEGKPLLPQLGRTRYHAESRMVTGNMEVIGKVPLVGYQQIPTPWITLSRRAGGRGRIHPPRSPVDRGQRTTCLDAAGSAVPHGGGVQCCSSMTDIASASDRELLAVLQAEKGRLQHGTDSQRAAAPDLIRVIGRAIYSKHFPSSPPTELLEELAGLYDPEQDSPPVEDL